MQHSRDPCSPGRNAWTGSPPAEAENVYYRVRGFAGTPGIGELVSLGRRAGVPVIVPAGSWLGEQVQRPNDAYLEQLFAAAERVRAERITSVDASVEVTAAGYGLFRRAREATDPPAPACPSGAFTVAVNRPGGQTWAGATPAGLFAQTSMRIEKIESRFYHTGGIPVSSGL